MTVADWQGSAFVLSTATGKTEIVDNSCICGPPPSACSAGPAILDAELVALMERELA